MADSRGGLSDAFHAGGNSGFRAVLSDEVYVPLSRVDAASRLGISKTSGRPAALRKFRRALANIGENLDQGVGLGQDVNPDLHRFTFL